MIVDTSALIAILKGEPGCAGIEAALGQGGPLAMSAATWFETAIVAEGEGGPAAGERLDQLLATLKVEVVALTAEQATLARDGWRRFGKGRHPARLNLGDCFSYALARSRDQPLLFKGDDFAQTDVKAAL